jgi:hypothetical protein
LNYFLAIICIIIGIVIIIFTNKEGKDDKPSFTVYYIMHLKGYIGGDGAILLGLLMMLQAFGWW